MVEQKIPENENCGCSFVINEAGNAEIHCPDKDAQTAAMAALNRGEELAVRVVPFAVPVGAGATDSVVQVPVDDADSGDDPEAGFIDFDDDADDFDFDDDDE